MSRQIVTMWRCDVCDTTTAPEYTEGWVDAIYTHGCPDHAGVVAAHVATVHPLTRKPRCACGWYPPTYWVADCTEPTFVAEHRVHVRTQATLAGFHVSLRRSGS